MVGLNAIVPVKFEATTRALVVSACSSRASIRVSGFVVVTCCTGLSVLGMSSAASRK